MDKDIQLWLHDMLAAIDEVFDFLPERCPGTTEIA